MKTVSSDSDFIASAENMPRETHESAQSLSDVTIVIDDEAQNFAHELSEDSSDVTISADDEEQNVAHKSKSSQQIVSTNVTIVSDDGAENDAHKSIPAKKRRRFKRIWLQPQLRKARQRKRKLRGNVAVSVNAIVLSFKAEATSMQPSDA